MSDFELFPPTAMLGFGLDFTTASPIDIQSAVAAIKQGVRAIDYSPYEDTVKVKVGTVVYDIPRVIAVIPHNTANGNYTTYRTGTEVASAFQVDVALSARYLAVSASTSVSYAINKNYKRDDQWAMYSLNADTYQASLQDYGRLLKADSLEERLRETDAIGDGSDPRVVNDWRAFFAYWGTHIIIQTSYGARFQLNVWASNSEESVNERFSVSVNAAFNGLAFGGSFDASVKNEEQYSTFENFMQKTVSIRGGNPDYLYKLAADPTKYDAYVEWADSIAEDSAVTNLGVTELWTLMLNSGRSDIRALAVKVQDAYNYFVSHPERYRTHVSLDIQSDWAEFNLLSPSAVIKPDPENPYPEYTVSSNTRVQWGREHSHEYERKQLRFYVENDNSPIDFSISHGSFGASPGTTGRAEVIIEQTSYLNDENTDDVWNSKWFYQAPVSQTRTQQLESERAVAIEVL